MLKISTKISLIYLSATASIIILMAVSMYYIYYSQRLQSIDSELQDYANFLTSNLSLESFNISNVFKAMNAKKDFSNLKLSRNYMFVLTDNDSIIYESNNSIAFDSLIKPITEIHDVTAKSKFHFIKFNNQSFRTFSRVIDSHTRRDLQIIMISSLERFNESLNLLKYILFIICPGFLLIAAFFGAILAKRSFAPVLQLTKAAELITAENLDKRVPLGNANDEITYLARTFNDMIDRLDKTFKSQKQFIADASHDFRTPLTVMRLEFEILLSKDNLNPDIRNSLIKSLQEVKSLSNLSDNLLLLARADSNQLILNKESFRFDELLLSTVSNFNTLASQKGVSFRIDINDDYEIEADREMMKRVLNNLFDNSVKYSIPNSIAEISLSQSGKNINLVVKNACENFDENNSSLIFDRFHREQHSRNNEGFGLGLPIVKTIVEAHNGEVNIEIKNNIFKISIII